MFDYSIFSTVKQGTEHYLVTINDTTELLGSCQYIVAAKNATDAQAKAMQKHAESKAKK